MTKVLAGHVAPAFTLPSTNGTEFSMPEALKKGPVVAAFFKISCPVCQYTFPFLERLYKAHQADPVTFIGISQDDDRDSKDFLKEYGITFPALVDARGYPVSNQFGLTNVPTVFLIAPDGKVKVSSIGFSKADIEQIARELAQRFQKTPTRVFLSSEDVPDYKPG